MKLVVQVSCLDEEKTILTLLQEIPKKIKGIDDIDIVVVDDACTDNTVAIAKKFGVKHFVYHAKIQGLAFGFRDALNKSLEIGADIIVHTDGDNQYPGRYIPDLVAPIVAGQADMVIADRQTRKIDDFSAGKKLMQRIGTKVLNLAAGTQVPDAPSGFRAYSREAAIRLNVVTNFSYAMETLIQASHKRLMIATVPITVNPKARESRLFKSSWQHVRKSGAAIIRAFVMYRPLMLFMTLGILLFLLGLIPFFRYLYLTISDHTNGLRHLQSLLAGSVLMIASFIAFTLGVVADLIRTNRILIEESLTQQKHIRFDNNTRLK
ncbi:MAG TPA: glycosyltransferase family 2 protein [Patescibacteria group bacterium]|nr:glycosyltransferase family 2 protein [Patescibacteria group bacterium]